MKRYLLISVAACAATLVAQAPKPKHINRVFAVAKVNKIFWNGINRDDAIDKIKQGYMIGFGPEAAETGRKFTKRATPY